MKIFSIVMLILLTSCNAFLKNADNFKIFGHDIVDEEVDMMKAQTEAQKQ